VIGQKEAIFYSSYMNGIVANNKLISKNLASSTKLIFVAIAMAISSSNHIRFGKFPQ
jgi:hypothetical protein